MEDGVGSDLSENDALQYQLSLEISKARQHIICYYARSPQSDPVLLAQLSVWYGLRN